MAKRFIKRIAALISVKTKKDYSQVFSNIRTRPSMDIMRSVGRSKTCTWEGKEDMGRPLSSILQLDP